MHDEVLAMVEEFYHSDAVCHPVPREKLEQTFADAVSDDPILEDENKDKIVNKDETISPEIENQQPEHNTENQADDTSGEK